MPTPLSLLAGETQRGAGAFGTVPTVPSPQETQAQALGGDLSQMANINAIAQALNQQSAQSAQYPLTLNLPNYQQAMGQAMGNVQQLLGGQVPGDVWNQIQQMGAERGTAIGSPMGPNANAALLRALGLTSLGLQEKGLGDLTGLMGAVPRGTLFDPSALLVSPAQQQQWQNLANQLAAAPSPTEAAREEMSAVGAGLGMGQGIGGGGGGGGISRIPAMTGEQAGAAFAQDWANRQLGATRASQEEEARTRAYLASPQAYANLPMAAMRAGGGAEAGGPVIDASGNEWVQLGETTWMNLSTGETSQGMPSTGETWSYQTPSGSSLAWTGEDLSGLFGGEQLGPEYGYWPETETYATQAGYVPAEAQYWPEPANVETPLGDLYSEEWGW